MNVLTPSRLRLAAAIAFLAATACGLAAWLHMSDAGVICGFAIGALAHCAACPTAAALLAMALSLALGAEGVEAQLRRADARA